MRRPRSKNFTLGETDTNCLAYLRHGVARLTQPQPAKARKQQVSRLSSLIVAAAPLCCARKEHAC